MTGSVRRAPLIVIGMHRSGTSLVTRLLEDAGAFLGARKQEDDEAVFFLKLNEWLFRQAGADWDHPEPTRHLLADREVRPVVGDYLDWVLRSPRSISFLGLGRYLRTRSVYALDEPWGWKDPRNTFTLPIWLERFGGARVLHVYRHGVDVAASLRTRQQRLFASRAARYRRRKLLYAVYAKQTGFTKGLRSGTLGEGLSLWETYLNEARDQLAATGAPSLELCYEDLLRNPEPHLARLVEFAQLEPTAAFRERALREIDPARAFAYRRSDELRSFAEKEAERLAAFGYEP